MKRQLARLLIGGASVVKRRVLRSWLAPYLHDERNEKMFTGYFVHEQMLNDALRVESYYRAISKLIKPGDIVVDLGTGTGILAFFAAKKAAKVYAIEHSAIIEVARKTAQKNGIDNVEFYRCNSRNFNLDERVDAIVHEQIGGRNPFSENMIQNILDLRERVLKKGGLIIPNRFEIYLEPIQLKESHRIPFIWESKINGIDFSFLKPPRRGEEGKITSYQARNITPDSVQNLLCTPKPIFKFDLETMNANELPKQIQYANTASRDGKLHGLCIYFKALFDDDIVIETSPIGQLTSWTMAMYRIETVEVRKGQRIEYDLQIGDFMDDMTWRLNWREPSKHN